MSSMYQPKRLSSVERSNKAHVGLFNKYIIKSGSFHSNIKAQYHIDVLSCQRASNKILDKSDKRTLYEYNRKNVLGTDKGPSSHDYLAVFKKYHSKNR